jgi:hypothetical protein
MGASAIWRAVRRAPQAGTLIALFLVSVAYAGDLSLPLDGYYRTGRFMPVRFSPGQSEVRICGDGVVTTVINSPTCVIAPCFMSRSAPPNPQFGSRLHELSPDAKLVGVAADAGDIPQHLFPGYSVITVHLDPGDPIPGWFGAWQCLDALVLDKFSAARLAHWQQFGLPDFGTALIFVGDRPPDWNDGWPWKQKPGYWVQNAQPRLDLTANDQAYAPVDGWNPGAPAIVRRVIFSFASVFVILFIMATLLRGRRGIIFPAGVAIAAVAGALSWYHIYTPIAIGSGSVRVTGNDARVDVWIYKRAWRDTDVREYFSVALLPEHGGPEDFCVNCFDGGVPRGCSYHLPAGHAIAFVGSGPDVGFAGASINAVSPLRSLVPKYYSGERIIGGLGPLSGDPPDENQWPGLLLASSDAKPK